jgi:hypothetical protein
MTHENAKAYLMFFLCQRNATKAKAVREKVQQHK